MLLIAVLLAASQAGQPASEQSGAQQYLHEQFISAAQQAEEFKSTIRSRGGLSPDEPRMGLEMESRDMGLGGEHPPRHTFVTGVFADSPADAAGIKPGDRILAIGQEDLDYESGIAVRLYLSNWPERVPLKIERNGGVLSFSVERAALPCYRTAFESFDQDKWVGVFEKNRKLLLDEAKALESPLLPLSRLQEDAHGLERTFVIWAGWFKDMQDEISAALASSCTVRR